jgi:transcriptional regulator with XRE-family HTH domain
MDESASHRFGQVVRQRREAYGWTQAELADRVNDFELSWHQSTVNKVETGLRPVTWDEAVVLAPVLGFSLADAAADDEQRLMERYSRLREEAHAHGDALRRLLNEIADIELRLGLARGTTADTKLGDPLPPLPRKRKRAR